MSYIIGIGGGSGSGKTTLCLKLKEIFQDDITILQLDHYCKDVSYLSEEERKKVNFDIPSAYDGDLFCNHLRKLKNNEAINRPIYDFATHSTKKGEYVKIKPSKIILLDGILIYQLNDAISLMNKRIFMDVSSFKRVKRRAKRDLRERRRVIKQTIKQFYDTVEPMHQIYVEPNKEVCDIIFDNEKDGELNEEQVAILVNMIKESI